MPNDKRITLKMLGVTMEVINVTADQFLKILKWAGGIAVLLLLVWRLPDIITALSK